MSSIAYDQSRRLRSSSPTKTMGVVTPLYLLLLPALAKSGFHGDVDSAYRIPITAVLEQLAYRSRWATAGAVLDIVVQIPKDCFEHNPFPHAIYDQVQSLFARLYRLVCIIAAEKDIDVEDDEGVDVRIVLLRSIHSGQQSNHADLADCFGPIISLEMLASSKREWQEVFSVEIEEGEELLRQYLTNQDEHVKISKVKAGSLGDDEHAPEREAQSKYESSLMHSSIAVGGTWDHIHIGHKLLLTMVAFLLGRSDCSPKGCLIVGTTGDSLLKNKKYGDFLQSWSDRQASARKFLEGILDFRPPASRSITVKEIYNPGPNGHAVHVNYGQSIVVKFVELWDPFGPTIEDETISALVISAETRSGGKAVNDKRAEKQWPLLQVYEIDVLDSKGTVGSSEEDASFQSKLSSTTIREALSKKGQERSKS